MRSILDSQQLRVFVAVARTLNMRRAAAELGLTPSAVSHGLKALETDLGCRLVTREPRRLLLSPAGELFLAEARGILEQMEKARGRVGACKESPGHRLRIRASGAVSRFVVAPALREFKESFPTFTIAIIPETDGAPGAEAGRAEPDLRLTPELGPGGSDRAIPIGEDDLQFYAHPLHAWAVRRSVDRDELPSRRLILPTEGSPMAERIRDYFLEEGLRLQTFVEVADESAALELIRLDLGVGILPRWFAAESVRAGTLAELPLGRRRLKRTWCVVPRRTGALTLAENLFVRLLQHVFREISPAALA